jgi:hypothetical protein
MIKYSLDLETIDYQNAGSINSDLHLTEPQTEFNKTTLIKISSDGGEKLIRIDCSKRSDNDFKHLIIEETYKLFFGASTFWGIIDYEKLRVERNETCIDFWNFEKHQNCIVVITELQAYSFKLNGEIIDSVPIDPPFESEDFTDRIEFFCPVYGRQTLKLK